MSTVLKNSTILVVDDDPDTRDILRIVLEASGAQVLVADSVDKALETFRRSPPHALIADLRLRTADGFELIKAVRAHNKEFRGFTPALAVTGFTSPEDEERALAAGFNDYITKPFNPADVVESVAKMLRALADSAA